MAVLDNLIGKPTLTDLMLKDKAGNVLKLQEVVATVTLQKNIVETALTGVDGTIKEYISTQDWQIELTCIVRSKDPNLTVFIDRSDEDYPTEQVQTWADFAMKNESMSVSSGFLSLFGIKQLVVKSFSANQETHSNRQLFTLSCVSDREYEIKLKL